MTFQPYSFKQLAEVAADWAPLQASVAAAEAAIIALQTALSSAQSAITTLQAASGANTTFRQNFDTLFEGVDEVGGTNCDSEATIPFSLERHKSGFTHTGNGEVTVASDGLYRVSGNITALAEDGLSPMVLRGGLQLDSGSGFASVSGAWYQVTLRPQLGIGLGTPASGGLSFCVVLNLSAGDVVRVRAGRLSGTSSLDLQVGSCLLIERFG